MVYLLVELFNYRQLARLRRDVLPGIEKRISELLAGKKTRILRDRDGAILVECGREADLEARACASRALQVHDFLKSARDDLFGFSILLAALSPEDPEKVELLMERILDGVGKEEELWLSASAAPLFSDCLCVEEGKEAGRVLSTKEAEPPAQEKNQNVTSWVRENLVQRLLDVLTPRLNEGTENQVVFLYGPPGTGKTELLREVARRLGVGDERAPLIRLFTLYKRKSPIHPFIGSLVPSFLSEVPGFLKAYELAVWNGVGQFLSFLGGMGPSLSFFPDHLQEDFTLGYLLYVRAFVRMTSSRFLPSFFACEGVETWHPDARRLTARLIKEFLPDSNFIPVLSSATEVVPEEFASFTVIPLCVHSLGKREIRSLSRRLFPGLEIPETEIHRIRQRTSGLCMPVISYLQYLFKTGKIRNAESRFQWVQSFEEESVLPANPLSVHWFLIRSLGDGIYLLLYALYLAAGLLDRKRLFQFLVEQGLERTDVERSLQTLIALGLVTDGDILVPRIPPLRRKLEELLGKEGERLRERLISHLYASWKKGEYPHRVLLFSFFARSGRTGLAVEVLPEVIRRKIDEGDLEGAGLFSDPRRLEFSVPPDAGQKETLKLISMTGRLRIALKDFRQERVEEIQIPARPVGADMDTEVAGDAALVRVLYRLAVGNSGSALEELKTALLEFQENGFERGERSAYHILGLTMMGEGRLGEAIEYLLLSERLHAEAADTLGALRSSSSLAVGYFLDGRLTQCLQTAERAETNAAAIGQREQELFARFLRARVCFQLGYYDECFTLLQQCLCDSVLYSMRGARVVLSAWLGRAMLYLGDVQSASRYLEKLEKSAEVFYFLAESSLFSHNLKNASRFAEQALESAGPSAFPPPEGVSWRDGFSSVEGRCFSLSRDNAFFRRGVRALTGCLLGMRGSAKEAIRELHRLTRGEEALGEDPGSYLHAYFYSLVLPELSTEEGDDKTTILSKSVKGLQGRASRIEAPAHKSAFLTASYWNRRIMEDARQRKLI